MTDARRRVKARAAGTCEACGTPFKRISLRKTNASMHHRKPRRAPFCGVDSVENLLHICNACHVTIHADERRAAKLGLIVWDEPLCRPFLLHGKRWVAPGLDASYEPLWPDEAEELLSMVS